MSTSIIHDILKAPSYYLHHIVDQDAPEGSLLMSTWRNTWHEPMVRDDIMEISFSSNIYERYDEWWVGISLLPIGIIKIDDEEAMEVSSIKFPYENKMDIR